MSVELDAESLAGLQALVADVGTGNVIDAELLDGCPVEAHELDEMDEAQAATVAAHCFAVLFDHRVQDCVGSEAEESVDVGNMRPSRRFIVSALVRIPEQRNDWLLSRIHPE